MVIQNCHDKDFTMVCDQWSTVYLIYPTLQKNLSTPWIDFSIRSWRLKNTRRLTATKTRILLDPLTTLSHILQKKKINKLKKTYKLNSTTYNVPLSPSLKLSSFLNPIHPNTSMYILHTVLCTFPKVLTKRICLRIQNVLCWWSFSLFSLTYMCDSGVIF